MKLPKVRIFSQVPGIDSPTGCLEHLADAQIPAKSL